MADIFGFPNVPANAGGDFIPVLKYDARAGRFFRMDRVDNGNGFVNEPIDITPIVKFIADFENLEVGWISFMPDIAPDFRLVPIGSQIPPEPSPNHKYGMRFMLKLSKECGGELPIREIAGTSKAFRGAMESVYTQYLAQKDKSPGKLPVITVEKITPVKTGSGQQSSTNYHPVFKISGWAPRGDLVFVSKAVMPSAASIALAATAAPSTGSTRVSGGAYGGGGGGATAPAVKDELADDFG